MTSYIPLNGYRGMVSRLDRLSENAKPEKTYIDSKGLMTRKFAKIPILGQPVEQ